MSRIVRLICGEVLRLGVNIRFPERVAAVLSTGQWYASRNCSYITTCCDELIDELGVSVIVEKPLET